MSRCVAWTGTAEWLQVFEWLYSDSELDRHKGVNRVCAWQARQKLPMAVEATSALVDVFLKDNLLTAMSTQEQMRNTSLLKNSVPSPTSIPTPNTSECVREGSCERTNEDRNRGEIVSDIEDVDADEDITVGSTSYTLRLMHSMAVVRFVNGMVDSVQRGTHARSVSALAAELGLPEWVVDFRHDATHTALPSLESCRMTSKYVLDWLKVKYWVHQARYETELKTLLKASLKAYVSAQEQLLALAQLDQQTSSTQTPTESTDGKGNSKGKKGKKTVGSTTKSVLAYNEERSMALDEVVRLCGSRGVACEILIPMLLKTGMMVPVEKKFRPSSLVSLRIDGNCEPKNKRLWETATSHFERVWPGFIANLLAAMLSMLTEVSQPHANDDADTNGVDTKTQHSPSRLRSIASWIVCVLNEHHVEPRVSIEESMDSLLSVCIEWTNEYTHTILPHLLRFSCTTKRDRQLDAMKLSYSNPEIRQHTIPTQTQTLSQQKRISTGGKRTHIETNDDAIASNGLIETCITTNHVSDEKIVELLSLGLSGGILGKNDIGEKNTDASGVGEAWKLLIGHSAVPDINDAECLTITPDIFRALREERRDFTSGHKDIYDSVRVGMSNTGNRMNVDSQAGVSVAEKVLKRVKLL
eukprot:CFRG4606T1